jgi:hypothetical protein
VYRSSWLASPVEMDSAPPTLKVVVAQDVF